MNEPQSSATSNPITRDLRDLVMRGTPGRQIAQIMRARFGLSAGDVLALVDAMLSAPEGDPLDRAAFALMGRAIPDETVPGGWRLGRRPSGAAHVVAEANKVLTNFGKPRIAYPGVEPHISEAA